MKEINNLFIYSIGALTYFAKRNEFYKATEWRNKLDAWAKDNGILTFNPAITWLKEINHTYSGKMIVDQNDHYINRSNIAVASLECLDYSPGSIYEFTRFKEQRKPLIAFGEPHWSPHINSCISERVNTIEDVIELLANEFHQGNF